MLTIYSKNGCSQCSLVKNFLNNKKIDYFEQLLTDEEIPNIALKTGAKSFPIVMEGDRYIETNDVFKM